MNGTCCDLMQGYFIPREPWYALVGPCTLGDGLVKLKNSTSFVDTMVRLKFMLTFMVASSKASLKGKAATTRSTLYTAPCVSDDQVESAPKSVSCPFIDNYDSEVFLPKLPPSAMQKNLALGWVCT
jgi:hypothetical protein